MNKQKSMVINFIYNFLYTSLNIIFPLITLPYASRIIGVSGIGKVNFSNSIVNYFLIFASLGIPNYGIMAIAKLRDDTKKLSKTFSEIFFINIISTWICVVTYYLMIFKINYFHNNFCLFIISGLLIILNTFNIDWLYNGLEEYRYITVRSIVFKILSLVLLFTTVRNESDYIFYALVNVVALGGNNIINMINSRKIVKLKFKNLNLQKHLKSIIMLLSIQIAVNIYINLDTTMLGVLAGNVSVGLYSNAIKINKIIVILLTSVSTILLPRLSYYVKQNNISKFNATTNKALKIIMLLSIPTMIGTFFLSDNIIKIMFGNDFLPAIITMRILSPLIVILSIGNLFGTQILMTMGEEKKLLISVTVGAIVNFVLNYNIIPRMQQNGAALSSVIAEFIVMLIQVILAIKYIKIEINYRFVLNIIISNIIMTILLLIISYFIKVYY